MNPLIDWHPHTMNGRYILGYVNVSIRMFEIESCGHKYILHCFLGPAKSLNTVFICVEDAQKTAQRILKNFLEKIKYEKNKVNNPQAD